MGKGDIRVSKLRNLPNTSNVTTLGLIDVSNESNYFDGYAIISKDSPNHRLYILNRSSTDTPDNDQFVASNVSGVVWERVMGTQIASNEVRGTFDITTNPAEYPKGSALSAVNATQTGNGSGVGPSVRAGDLWYVIGNDSGTDTIGPSAKQILTNNAVLLALVNGAGNDDDDWIILEASAGSDLAPNIPSLRTLGTGAQQAVAGNDPRLSNSRTPLSHGTSHRHGGNDEIATATPSANEIPKADSQGRLNGWISAASTTTAGKIALALQATVDAGVDNTQAVTPLTLGSRLTNFMPIIGGELGNNFAITRVTGGNTFGFQLNTTDLMLYWSNGSTQSNAVFVKEDLAILQSVNTSTSRAATVYTSLDGYVRVGRNINPNQFKGLMIKSDSYSTIDWTTDADKDYLIPTQLRVQAMIDSVISTRTTTPPEGADFILFSDTSDSGNLKRALISTLAGGSGGHIIQNNSVSITQREKLNFIGALSITDDNINNATNVLLSSGHTIQSSGSTFSQRTNLNFIGFSVTDDSSNNRTNVSYTPTNSIKVDEFIYSGSNSFTLSQTPIVVTGVFINGSRIKETVDFTVSGTTLTLLDTLVTGDEISVTYHYGLVPVTIETTLPALESGKFLSNNGSTLIWDTLSGLDDS